MTICRSCQKEFEITRDDLAFYEKIDVPPPTFCPGCRYQRRLANRNEWNFYRRDCSLCKKGMISIYNPDYAGPVFCQPCYWSDGWDPLEYGREFDFSRPFFEQFREHRFAVPRITLANEGSVNSEYTNQSNNNKNCYMTVAVNRCEDCMYGNWNQGSKDCIDCWNVDGCELMYESLDCLHCSRSAFIETCADMTDCFFCLDCKGLTSCFGCVNLRNKSYFWFNEQLTREEYKKRFDAIEWTPQAIAGFRKQFDEFKAKMPVKYFHGTQIRDSSGDYIGFSKNMQYAFNCFKCENFRFGQDAWEARDCRDLTETLDNELDYEMEGAGWGGNNIVSCKHWYGSRIAYSELSFHSDDLFGCVSMIKKQYCIFNTQYSKDEYLQLRARIIAHMKETGEWGEFFPIAISPFPYNDTVAQNYFPLDRKGVIGKGWKWYDVPPREHAATLHHNDLPERVGGISDDILQETIRCSSQDSEEGRVNYLRCATAFRLHPQELLFYRRLKLSIPHKCFPCRLQDRLNRRNPRALYHRKCACDYLAYRNEGFHLHHPEGPCLNEFKTSYAPDRPEIVYCESCYQSEVA